MSNKKNDILILALLERKDVVRTRIVEAAKSADPREQALVDHYIKQTFVLDEMIREATLNPKFKDEPSPVRVMDVYGAPDL